MSLCFTDLLLTHSFPQMTAFFPLLLYHRALYSADNYPFLSDTYLCKFKDIFANLNLALKSAACTS